MSSVALACQNNQLLSEDVVINVDSVEERIDLLEKKVFKVKEEQAPSKCRQAGVVAAFLAPALIGTAFPKYIPFLITVQLVSSLGATSKSVLRNFSLKNRCLMLSGALGVGIVVDQFSPVYLNLAAVASSVAISVLNREIKLWILGKDDKK